MVIQTGDCTQLHVCTGSCGFSGNGSTVEINAQDHAPVEAAVAETVEGSSEAPAHPETVVSSVNEFVSAVFEDNRCDVPWYRGHSVSSYALAPSIARPPCSEEKELALMGRFQQNAYPFLPLPSAKLEEWEQLFLMQHYRAPTRLLDWSDSPLVALYFAVENESKDGEDGCVWRLDPIELNRSASLVPKHDRDIPLFGASEELDTYLPSRIHQRPTMSSNSPAAGIAPRRSDRIYAQMGSFTITHRVQTPLEEISANHLHKIVVSAASKEQVRTELTALRITKLSVFPELENVATAAQEGLW